MEAGVYTDGAHAAPRPCVTSVNVGGVREVAWHGSLVRTAIWKAPVGTRPVAIRGVNVDGDDQADRVQHGGPDKAVYAYAEEDYYYSWASACYPGARVCLGPGRAVRGEQDVARSIAK